MNIKTPIDPTFTIQQVADFHLLGTSNYEVIARNIRQGRLGAIKAGKEYRISVNDIKEFNKKYIRRVRNT